MKSSKVYYDAAQYVLHPDDLVGRPSSTARSPGIDPSDGGYSDYTDTTVDPATQSSGASPLGSLFQRVRNSTCERWKDEDRAGQEHFRAALNQCRFREYGDEIDSIQARLNAHPVFAGMKPNSVRRVAEGLVVASLNDIKHLSPISGRVFGGEHGISISGDSFFVHKKKEMGRGHSKVAYTALRVDRETFEVSPVIHKKVLNKDGFFADAFREIELAEMMAKESLPHLVDPPLALFQYCSKGQEQRLAVYEAPYLGSLDSLHLNMEQRIKVLSGAAEGLQAMHSEALVHGDLTAGNIFSDEAGNGYLSDFGASQPNGQLLVPGSASLTHRPPEEYGPDLQIRLTPAGDVWSFGMVTCQMLTRRRPSFSRIMFDRARHRFETESRPHLTKDEIHKDLFIGWDPKDATEARLQELVIQCLDLDPVARPSAETIGKVLSEISA